MRRLGSRRAWRLVLGASLAGCTYEVQVGSSPDAAQADLAAATLCEASDTSTVAGSGPDGSLDGYHVFANLRGGECQPALELVVSPTPSLQLPLPAATVVIKVALGGDLVDASADWAGTLPATIADRDGERVGLGRIDIVQATAAPAEGAAAAGATRLRAIATFDVDGWQVTATIDTPYCLIDACPCCLFPP